MYRLNLPLNEKIKLCKYNLTNVDVKNEKQSKKVIYKNTVLNIVSFQQM